jgi:hypothetical protein
MPQTPNDRPPPPLGGSTPPQPAAPRDPRAHEDASKSGEPPPWRGVPGVTGPADGSDPAAAGED